MFGDGGGGVGPRGLGVALDVLLSTSGVGWVGGRRRKKARGLMLWVAEERRLCDFVVGERRWGFEARRQG